MKKICLLFLLLGITLFTVNLNAQESKVKVAVLDPTTSGISMDEGTKLAVQELISSSLVNTGKFTIVERSMIDKIVKEQSFQNSDIADNSQATAIGKLSGASKVFLSVVSLVGGRNMLSIKIIDVETATIEQQKTKIVNSSDLLDIVEPLTLELIGEKANSSYATVSPHNNISTDLKSPQTQIRSPQTQTIRHELKTYTQKDITLNNISMGGLITFDDGTKGIVFYIDGSGHGLVVSLDETETKWQNESKSKKCQDISQLINENEQPKYLNMGLGKQQTQMIISQLGWGEAPAAEWCLRHGDGWYLPSSGELWYLFTEANYTINSNNINEDSFDAKDGFISMMLKMAGGQPLNSAWYWSSSEEEQENAWNVSNSGKASTEEKTEEVAVRAVRFF